MKLRILRRHVEKSDKGAYECVVAQAAMEHFRTKNICAGLDNLRVRKKYFLYSRELIRVVRLFDAGQKDKIELGRYELKEE